MPARGSRTTKVTAADARRRQLFETAEQRRLEVAEALSTSEERLRATSAFVTRWTSVSRERAESQSFWNDLFAVLGLDRFAEGVIFEHPVTRAGSGGRGYIDVFWPGRILVEQKSLGRDLEAALAQADDYVLPDEDQPRLTVACDFDRFVIRDNHTQRSGSFPLAKLPKNIGWFGPLILDEVRELKAQAPVDVHAAEATALIHDQLRAAGYEGHELRLLMTRLVFCFFANDTGIWPAGAFERYLRSLPLTFTGAALAQLFQVLNTPVAQRQASLDPALAVFPYVNGGLFADPLPFASFTPELAELLVTTSEDNDWSAVSPAVFGAMFQGVMDADERHNLGAHYTSEENIRRVIDPLFLDDLYTRAEAATTVAACEKLWAELATLRFLDPAAGCGNFLVVAYRELRRLEKYLMSKLKAIAATDPGRWGGKYPWAFGQRTLDFGILTRLDVGQFYGIEIDEWPAEIARVAMWLTDHLANMELEAEFGGHQARLPLKSSVQMTVGNALRIDWSDVLPASECSYVFGNPPFLGHKERSQEQASDMSLIWGKGAGRLDYVTCWFKKAADYIEGASSRAAFVATSSISQGVQPQLLWSYLEPKGFFIDFAHQDFQWTNEARGKAAVQVVIVGFSATEPRGRLPLWSYDAGANTGVLNQHDVINGYLVGAPRVLVQPRRSPIVETMPRARYGSMPIDKGQLVVSASDAANLRSKDAVAAALLRPYLGGEEVLHGGERYCLWLPDAEPKVLRASSFVMNRIEAVRRFRSESGRTATQALADTPALFGEIRQPSARYLAIPKVSTGRRRALPVAILAREDIASGSLLTVEADDLETPLGLLASRMFWVWHTTVSGRLGPSSMVSVELTYNNFPWPELTEETREGVAEAAKAVLAARAAHTNASLADLYDPLAMPADLVKAHKALDRVVMGLYGLKAAATDSAILEVLFSRYAALTAQPTE